MRATTNLLAASRPMLQRSAINSTRRLSDFVHPLLDAFAVFVSLALVQWIETNYINDRTVVVGLTSALTFVLVSQLTGLNRRQGVKPSEEISLIATTWCMTILALGVLSFLTRGAEPFARIVITSWMVMAPAAIGFFRMIVRIVQQGLLKRGIGIRRVAVAGYNELGIQTVSNIAEEPSLGIEIVGYFDDRELARHDTALAGETQLCGSLKQLVESARSGEIDMVLITLPMRAEKRIRYLLDELSDTTASVYIVPDFFVFELLHARMTSMGGLPAVSVFENPLFGVDGVAKRVVDVAIALAAIIALALPMVLIALLIKLTSPGPVFFRQRRYGLDGREIRVWKFRSMRVCDDGQVVKQATRGDSRITPIGAILRRTSLDELPQLFNVIDGSMSLVGPRPHATAHNEQYRGLIRGYMLRHKVKPGITGLAQVNGCRGETETIDKMQQRVSWDHRYIRSWSLWLDVKILLKTLVVAWRQPEAF